MKRKNKIGGAGLGVGYVSVMIIFAVICLTIFAVLSFRAAVSDGAFNERSGEYLRQYYAADGSAKATLAELDGIARAAAGSGFFEDEFETAAEALEGVFVTAAGNGFSASWTVKINDRQELYARAAFTADGEYEITSWRCRGIGGESEDKPLNVWQGGF